LVVLVISMRHKILLKKKKESGFLSICKLKLEIVAVPVHDVEKASMETVPVYAEALPEREAVLHPEGAETRTRYPLRDLEGLTWRLIL
jgi:hypothetical protein